MKKPQRYIGFVKFRNTSFPFEFDEEHFSLNLYPPDLETQEQYSSIIHTLEKLTQFTESVNDWIPFEDIQGTTSEGHNIRFHVSSNYISYHGFLNFSVAWYFVWEQEYSEDSIYGLHLQGPEIDAFFPPDSVFKYDIEPDGRLLGAKKLTVSAEKQNEVTGGSYQISDELVANIYFYSYATLMRSANPVISRSRMTIVFSKAVDLPTLIRVQEHLERLFMYVTDRANVSLNLSEVFTLNRDGKRYSYGWFGFLKRFSEETSPKAKKQIIDFTVLGEKTADLMQVISTEQIGYEYLPRSVDDKNHYTVSRFILTLAAFERECRNIYGTDIGRSERFTNVKMDIVRLAEEYRDRQTGKRKGYAADLIKAIQNFDLGYWFNVQYALKDCRDIMETFTVRKYGTPPKPFDALAEEISHRVGELRNNLAHDKLDWSFEAIQISDIKVVEELLYAIRLKQIGLEKDKIREGIKNLFQEI